MPLEWDIVRLDLDGAHDDDLASLHRIEEGIAGPIGDLRLVDLDEPLDLAVRMTMDRRSFWTSSQVTL